MTQVIHNLDRPFRRIEKLTLFPSTESLEDAWREHRDLSMRHRKATTFIQRGARQKYEFVFERISIFFLSSDPFEPSGLWGNRPIPQKAPAVSAYTPVLCRATREAIKVLRRSTL